MKSVSLILIALITITVSCKTQQGSKSNLTNSIAQEIKFEKIIYHSSLCFGSCPVIDLQIDSNKNILLRREVVSFKRNNETPSLKKYNGFLTQPEYDSVLTLLKKADYKNLQFEDVQCCDGVITTLIIYSGGDKKYLKSMMPSQQSQELINYLHKLGMKTDLPEIKEEIKLEE